MNRIPVLVDRDLRVHIGPRPGDGLLITLQLDRVSAQDLADHLNESVGRRAALPGAEYEIPIDGEVSFETEAEREARAAAEEEA